VSRDENEGFSSSKLDFLLFMSSLSSFCLPCKQKADRRRDRDIIGRSGEGFLQAIGPENPSGGDAGLSDVDRWDDPGMAGQ
jgi:hypothetical protein